MDRYDKYKDSRVEWIGQVPEHWEVRKLKYIMQLCTEIANNNNKIGLENIESTTGQYIETDNEFEGNGVLFQIDDILYGKLRPYLKKVWLATFKGNAVGDFFVFRPSDETNAPYYKYIMLSDGFSREANGATAGAKMPRVPLDFLLNMLLPLPPLQEQRAIAAYLDERCGRIDRVVAAERRRIALLDELRQSIITHAVTRGLNPDAPLKDSQVEWIGQVPEHWEVSRLKFFISIKSGDYINADDISETGTYPLYGGGGQIGFVEKYNVPTHAIIIGRVGAKCGCVTFANEESCATDNALILKTTKNARYLYHILIAANLNNLNESNAQPLITGRKVLELFIPLPPLPEQQAIASYLDTRTAALDAQKLKSERRIALLSELKQSIITEAVTGKVKIS